MRLAQKGYTIIPI